MPRPPRSTDATRDDEALAIDVPSDGGFESLRSIMERLDRNGIEARALGIHTPTSTTCSSP